jgi:hypothetical protein
LNPHGTGSYLVVYEQKLGDFVLEFDYKLSKGCNSGVFLRVGNLADPVHTGIEVALDDTIGIGNSYGDSGAFYGLVAPAVNAQKPAGEWNHMMITAAGADMSVSLNGIEVARIDLDEWSVPRQLAPQRLPGLPGPAGRLLVQEHRPEDARRSRHEVRVGGTGRHGRRCPGSAILRIDCASCRSGRKRLE